MNRIMNSWWKDWSSSWVYHTVVLSVFGFFANFRPAEPFLTPYLVGPYKNISEEQVTNILYPIWTYSYLALLLPVFLLTDYLRYKPIIVVQGVCLVINWTLLCFAQGMPAMKYLHFNNGIATATDVAYFSYIYCVIPSDRYQKVTSYLRTATLVGYTVGSTLGQLLVSVAGLPYFYLNAINLGSALMACLSSFLLPMPRAGGMFFNKETAAPPGEQCQDSRSHDREEDRPSTPPGDIKPPRKKGQAAGKLRRKNLGCAVHLLWTSFIDCYSSRKLIYWSLWWAFATCGYYQIFNYIQLMWNHIEPSGSSPVFNGGVEAVTTLVGAIAAFSVGFMKLDWDIWGELALGLFSAISSGAVYATVLTDSIWVSYAGYVTFKASYMLLITITTFQIAANLSLECYALVFGINTFVALLLQTILTAIVVDESGLGLSIVKQFIVYGTYYVVISLLFLGRGLYTMSRYKCRSKNDSSQDVPGDSVVISSYKF
ncbi:solute carrier family 19 member 3b [Lepisosteus oculatus]|uniref:solute carrier family 19 member 3b n=1 Tax=Lepisosteus oculatus TaxID=7918 RepID=UPI0035F52F91